MRAAFEPRLQVCQQFFLTGLAKNEPVESKTPFECMKPLLLAAERNDRNAPLDLGAAFDLIHPVGDGLNIGVRHVLPLYALAAVIAGAGVAALAPLSRKREENLPWVASPGPVRAQTVEAELPRDIFPDRMSLVSMHAAFTLFHVDRVRREIPVVHRVAIRMKVQSFLPD